MRRKLLAGAAIVALVTLAVGVVTTIWVRERVRVEAESELVRQAEVTAYILEQELSAIGTDFDRLTRAEILAFRADARRILERARIVGGHDIVEAAIVLRGRIVPLVADPVLLERLPPDPRAVTRVVVDGAPMLATVRRITLGTRGPEVIVAIGRTEPLFPVRAVTRSVLLALGVGAVLVVGFATWFSRTEARRLADLEAASRALAAGDLDVRVPIDGDDEIAEVAAAFNDMADDLAAARRRERDFLMSVGHDLRTPLTSIRGYAEALAHGAVSADDLPRVAGVLHRQTDRLRRLIEDLMLLARLEAREFTLRPEPVDLTAHVKGVVEAYRPRTEAAAVRLELDAEPVGVVEVDPDRVSQILGNLLDNALRYTPEGGSVTVGVRRAGDGVLLEVSDTGPGIDEEDLDRVFERLFVTQRYRPVRPEGSGLGLAIVKELVDALGGRVVVDSRPGEGSRFTVELPAPSAAPPNSGP